MDRYPDTQKKIRQMLDCVKNLQCTIEEMNKRMEKIVEGVEVAYDDYPALPAKVDEVMPQINAAIGDATYLIPDLSNVRRMAQELQWEFDDDEENQREFDAWITRMAVLGNDPDRPF